MGVDSSTVLTTQNIADFATGIVSHEGTEKGIEYTNGYPGNPNDVYDKWDAIARKPATLTDAGADNRVEWLDGGINAFGMNVIYFAKDAIGSLGGDHHADVPLANLSNQRKPAVT